MIVSVTQAARMVRPANTDVSDLTTARRDGDASWEADGSLVLPFCPEPSDDEQHLIVRRLLTRDAAEARIVTALADQYDALDPAVPAENVLRLLVEARIGRIEGW